VRCDQQHTCTARTPEERSKHHDNSEIPSHGCRVSHI
jgi:hypothetical protein